jgi:hypothetical protein
MLYDNCMSILEFSQLQNFLRRINMQEGALNILNPMMAGLVWNPYEAYV